jgi:hypothetical protein
LSAVARHDEEAARAASSLTYLGSRRACARAREVNVSYASGQQVRLSVLRAG